jgi:hypothetical protein
MNQTLYNARDKFEEPDWSEYDRIEIHPVRTVEITRDGRFVMEPCDEEPWDAECWTIYGHMPGLGCEAICDATTQQLAKMIAATFRSCLREAELARDAGITLAQWRCKHEWPPLDSDRMICGKCGLDGEG